MIDLKLIKELSMAINELDHNKVSWIDKHLVIDLQDKGIVLLESLNQNQNEEANTNHIMDAIIEFLTEVKPVIQELKKQENQG